MIFGHQTLAKHLQKENMGREEGREREIEAEKRVFLSAKKEREGNIKNEGNEMERETEILEVRYRHRYDKMHFRREESRIEEVMTIRGNGAIVILDSKTFNLPLGNTVQVNHMLLQRDRE